MMQGAKPHKYIVDDDVSVRKALERLLYSAGFEVETLSSTRTLLDSVPSDADGNLILNLCMSHMVGIYYLKSKK